MINANCANMLYFSFESIRPDICSPHCAAALLIAVKIQAIKILESLQMCFLFIVDIVTLRTKIRHRVWFILLTGVLTLCSKSHNSILFILSIMSN